MGTKAIEIAIALDIERESYYRLEREWWTINAGEMDTIANTANCAQAPRPEAPIVSV